MLEINIEKRGELYKDYQQFRLKINGDLMIDGDYKAQDVQDFMSTICAVSEAFTGHSGLCTACNMSPKTKGAYVQIEDDRQQQERNDFRQAAARRNAEREQEKQDSRERSINEEHGKGRCTNRELEEDKRNALTNAGELTAKPLPMLKDRPIYSGASKRAQAMRPTKPVWRKAVEFFTGKES